MKITEAVVKYTAELAKLNIPDRDTDRMAEELSRILEYMAAMNGLDTDKVEPMTHVPALQNVFREDIVMRSEDLEILLANAPSQKDGYFAVPKTLE